jgi:glycogen synthase
MHLRLVSALFKPGTGRLTEALHSVQPDPALRAVLLDRIALPRRGLTVLDDRPLAAVIGALTAERGVSIAFAALIAHAQAAGQPILIAPGNQARWTDAAETQGVEVMVHPAQVAR